LAGPRADRRTSGDRVAWPAWYAPTSTSSRTSRAGCSSGPPGAGRRQYHRALHRAGSRETICRTRIGDRRGILDVRVLSRTLAIGSGHFSRALTCLERCPGWSGPVLTRDQHDSAITFPPPARRRGAYVRNWSRVGRTRLGSDPIADVAIRLRPAIEAFLRQTPDEVLAWITNLGGAGQPARRPARLGHRPAGRLRVWPRDERALGWPWVERLRRSGSSRPGSGPARIAAGTLGDDRGAPRPAGGQAERRRHSGSDRPGDRRGPPTGRAYRSACGPSSRWTRSRSSSWRPKLDEGAGRLADRAGWRCAGVQLLHERHRTTAVRSRTHPAGISASWMTWPAPGAASRSASRLAARRRWFRP